jgi:hypothetical protein
MAPRACGVVVARRSPVSRGAGRWPTSTRTSGTHFGGKGRRRLTELGTLRRCAVGRSAQRWQARGEVTGAEGDVGEQQDSSCSE